MTSDEVYCHKRNLLYNGHWQTLFGIYLLHSCPVLPAFDGILSGESHELCHRIIRTEFHMMEYCPEDPMRYVTEHDRILLYLFDASINFWFLVYIFSIFIYKYIFTPSWCTILSKIVNSDFYYSQWFCSL